MHHRGHAAQALSKAAIQLESGHQHYITWTESVTIPASRGIHHRQIIGFFIQTAADLTEATALLQDETPGKLDEARRLLSEPNRSVRPMGTTRKLRQLLYYLGFVIPLVELGDSSNNESLKRVLVNVATLWLELDYALWHIQDATREEVYNDPAFSAS